MDEAVRWAGAEDLDDLAAMAEAAAVEVQDLKGGQRYLDREARRPPARASFEHDLANPDAAVLLGVIDDVSVGFASVSVEELPTGSLLATLGEIWVLPDARGVSIGELMLAEIRTWATARGCTHLEGWVHPGNRPAKNFFETAGMVTRLLRVSTALGEPSPPDD